MKKLMTILVVFAMCGAVMAQDVQTVDPNKPIDLTMETKQVTTQEYGRYWNGRYYTTGWHNVTTTEQIATTRDYLNIKEDGTLGKSGLTYTVTASSDYGEVRNYDRQIASGYFTVTEDVPANKVVAVQFLGAEPEYGTGRSAANSSFRITDYGIYLYDPEQGKIGEYLSVKDYANYWGEDAGVKAGTSFGVYYVDQNGNIVASTGDGMKKQYGNLVAADNGILGNFDDDSHELKVYDPVTGKQETVEMDKHFLCLSAGDFDNGKRAFLNEHWEFMLQTTLDDPYYPVNPNDFNDPVHVDDPVVNGNTSGQPLPGTLATLLIGGLCAGSLRKRNKK